jgi:hypothetical protein
MKYQQSQFVITICSPQHLWSCLVPVTRISSSTIVWAHKDKCLAFSLDLPRGSKSLWASPNGLARSRKAGSRRGKSRISQKTVEETFECPKRFSSSQRVQRLVCSVALGLFRYPLVWAKKVSLAAICLVAGSASFGLREN